jgi:hypothetical protein
MTPTQYIEQLTALVASGQEKAALDLASRFWPTVSPQLSGEELEFVSGLMESAETALGMLSSEGVGWDDPSSYPVKASQPYRQVQ